MNLKNYILIACCALATMPAAAQRTTKLTASKANDYGVAYTLPLTAFDIVVETELTETSPGEFANYASLFLNADNAITEPGYSASVKSVTVVPHGVPDENNRWLIDFRGSGITYVMLDEAGVPLAINTEDVKNIDSPTLPKSQKAAPTALETEAAKYAVTQEMSASTSVSKRAQLASQRIFELRETRSDLISGNAENTPPDGQSMKLMLDNLAAQEAALTAMFVGTGKKWTDVKTVTYIPTSDDESVTKRVIARVSPVAGVVDPDDLSGAPLTLTVEVLSTGEIPLDEAGAPKKAPKDGVAYTIPGSVQLSLTYNGSEVYSQSFDVAQHGTTFFLDPKIFTDKKAPAFATFSPITGGILQLGTLAE